MNTLTFYTYDDYTVRTELTLGPVAPRSSDDLLMQLRNTGNTFQAEDVTVEVSDTDQLLLSMDGDTFTRTVTVGDIPPGSGSAVFTLRRVTPSTAGTGAASGTLTASPAAWTNVLDQSLSDNIPLDAEVDLDAADDDITNPPT